MAKSVNPRQQVPYILKADQAILDRRKALEEEKKAKAGEGEEDTAAAEGSEASEVLDPAWRPTVFQCTIPTTEEHAYLQDMASLGEMMLKTLDFGLADLENLLLEDGTPLKLQREKDKKALFGKHPWKRSGLDRISAEDRNEVATFILEGCKLKAAEAKNS